MKNKRGMTAELYGTRELAIIDIHGDDLTPSLKDERHTDMMEYIRWVGTNFTDGKKLPICNANACSVFCVNTEGKTFAGRNMDYPSKIGSGVVVRNYPKNGYRSIGTSSWESMFEQDETFDDAKNDIRMFAAGMCVVDGMNEKGLMCATLVTLNEAPSKSTDNAICEMGLVRYLLDKAATVDEAIGIVRTVGFDSELRVSEDEYKTVHLFVADAGGKCLVIESLNGKLLLTVGKEADVVTNHCLNKETTKVPTESSINRYNVLRKEVDSIYERNDICCSVDQCRDFLNKVAKIKLDGDLSGSLTRWSVVYDFDNMELSMWLNAKFDVQPHVFKFSDM